MFYVWSMAKKLKFKRLARSLDFEKSGFFCFVYFIFMVVLGRFRQMLTEVAL